MSNDKRAKILYMEDEDDIREVVVTSLELFGNYEVKHCSSGREALEICNNFSPDLLLLDVMIPGIDGPTTLSELRKIPRLKDVPAIFITAKVQSNEVKEYSHMGSVGVIKKPFEVSELAETIEKHLKLRKK